ncbi:diguanylate cyclase regulator RdcB family protein [Cytobacillus sp. S13-E01]|uniref:diguanylate cyclase regulator RdcB family protein n=1 Tax=Cytobacillus sp. S13-E01 TaxID=3031326 RepID=UPI0023D81EAC|nr:diguanylate cyclase regulator RdcB family protein [Cytobacillus sp. S13-E01]MDF0728679.1 diguanylate cyclase regulator RdcB family protein [Cytobacillus sp. S13-E01]
MKSVEKNTENEIQEFVNNLPILKEKMMVDFINGLEVSNDHLQVRSKRGSLFSRFWDGITGTRFERQQRVDEQFQRSLETVNIWLQQLQGHQLETYRAITIVSDKLYETRQGIEKLVKSHLKLRSEVEELEERFNQFALVSNQKMTRFQEEIERLGLRQSAMIALDNVFYSWESGTRFRGFSPLIQLLLVLEELYWSPFGEYDKLDPEFRNQLRDRCIIQMKKLTGYSGKTILPTKTWLEHITTAPALQKEAVQSLLGPAQRDISLSQMVLVASKSNNLIELKKGAPIVLTSSRLSEHLIKETGERLYA